MCITNKKQIEAPDYDLNCIVNRGGRKNYFSVLQDMFMELQEEVYGNFRDGTGCHRVGS